MRVGENMSSQIENQPVNRTQLYILMAIANGCEREKEIQRIVRLTATTLKQQIRELELTGCIEKTGLILKSWRLTQNGLEALSAYATQLPQIITQPFQHRSETKITTSFGTAFKTAFAATLGIFAGIIAIGAIASIIYWAGYTFIIKNYVPSSLLPYIPLDNPLVDFILGLATSATLFPPLRNKFGGGFFGR
jgi:DNA-binding MarR family transcriptional regulator